MNKLFYLLFAGGLFVSSSAGAETTIKLYKSLFCGCCEEYIDYLRENGFTVETETKADMDSIRRDLGSSKLASCHTSVVEGYTVEGHVPVGAINKLLKEKPDIVGISVPDMPKNAPGMGKMIKGRLKVYELSKDDPEARKTFSIE